MYTPVPRLILHPADPRYVPGDHNEIFKALLAIGLLTETTCDKHTYLAGKEFINLLTFLGCSPEIKLSPQDGENFCSISIPGYHEDNMLLGYTSTIIPRCPACKHKVNDWKQHIHDWKHGNHIYHCTECQQQTPVAELNWRQEGGYGHCAIIINHIHPHEAVPADKLLSTLQQASQTEWVYCYANN